MNLRKRQETRNEKTIAELRLAVVFYLSMRITTLAFQRK